MTLRLPASINDATHTVQRMIERQITWPEMIAVVDHPEKTVQGHSGRVNHYGVVNGRRIRVTVDHDGVVWTVTRAGGKK